MSSIPRAPAAQPAPARSIAARARPAEFSPLRAILRKELTENLKWVVASLLLQSLVLGIYLWNAFTAKDFGPSHPVLHPDNALFDSGMQNIAMVFAIGTAIFIAAFQIFTERTFDLRAFFRHRAISPSRLFLAKALAGLIIYSLCIALPILLFILWSATSPSAGILFDITFAQPYLVYFFCGLAYYFAALLVAVREVRWYMSRTLPFAAAILASLCTFNCHSFSLALFAVLAIDTLLALAAWNAYIHAGVDLPLGQPPLAAPKLSHPIAPLTLLRKFTLPTIILSALTLISCLLVFLNAEIFYLASKQAENFRASTERYGENHFNSYYLLPDGTPAIIRETSRRAPGDRDWTFESRFTDLAGHPLPAPATQPAQGTVSFSFSSPPVSQIPYYYDPTSKIALLADGIIRPEDQEVDIFRRAPVRRPGIPTGRWYYVLPWRLFVGYDLPDGHRIATIGASGYSTGYAEPFPASAVWDSQHNYLLVGNRAIQLAVDTDPSGHRYATPVLEAPAGETIRRIFTQNQMAGDAQRVQPNADYHLHTIMVTDKNLHLFLQAGPYQTTEIMVRQVPIPIEHPLDQYHMQITFLPQTDRIAIRYSIHDPLYRHTTTEYLSTFSTRGQPVSQYTLPPLPPETRPDPLPAEKTALFTVGLLDSFRNPWIATRFPIDIHDSYSPHSFFGSVSTLPVTVYQSSGNSSVSAFYYSGLLLPILLASACTLFLTTRYRFTLLGRILWTLATLVFGPLALLTLLFTQPLPARLPCPACKNKRLATLPLCPHCQAPFPAPTPTGNEIFAPV